MPALLQRWTASDAAARAREMHTHGPPAIGAPPRSAERGPSFCSGRAALPSRALARPARPHAAVLGARAAPSCAQALLRAASAASAPRQRADEAGRDGRCRRRARQRAARGTAQGARQAQTPPRRAPSACRRLRLPSHPHPPTPRRPPPRIPNPARRSSCAASAEWARRPVCSITPTLPALVPPRLRPRRPVCSACALFSPPLLLLHTWPSARCGRAARARVAVPGRRLCAGVAGTPRRAVAAVASAAS